MKKRKMRFVLAAVCMAGLLGACGQSDEVSLHDTQSAQSETAEESEADGTAENGSENETEESSMTGITPVRIYGVISEVWADQNTIVVDNQSDASSPGEIELKIDTENTLVLDATTGYPVSLEEVQTGSFEAYLGGTMTMSLPPQTTPYVVIVNIPADYGTPQYAIVEQIEKDEDGDAMVTATDGRSYEITVDTQIVPYRTKNIVTVDDIQAGSVCLIWPGDDGAASKVQIFE